MHSVDGSFSIYTACAFRDFPTRYLFVAAKGIFWTQNDPGVLRTMTFIGDNWEEEVEAALH